MWWEFRHSDTSSDCGINHDSRVDYDRCSDKHFGSRNYDVTAANVCWDNYDVTAANVCWDNYDVTAANVCWDNYDVTAANVCWDNYDYHNCSSLHHNHSCVNNNYDRKRQLDPRTACPSRSQ